MLAKYLLLFAIVIQAVMCAPILAISADGQTSDTKETPGKAEGMDVPAADPVVPQADIAPAKDGPVSPTGMDAPAADAVVPEAGMTPAKKEPVSAEGSPRPGADKKTEGKPDVKARRLSMKEVIELALKNNRPYQNSKLTLTQSYLQRDSAESEFEIKLVPTVKETLSGNHTIGSSPQSSRSETYDLALKKRIATGADLSVSVGTNTADDDVNRYTSNMKVSVSQPLLKGAWPLVATAGLTDARRAVMIQQLNDESSRQQLIVDMIDIYFRLLNQMELVDINQKSLERLKQFARATTARMEVGMATQADVTRADLRVYSQNQNYIRSLRTLEDQMDDLKTRVVLNLDEKIELTDRITGFKPLTMSLEEALKMAEESRQDFKIAQISLEDADRRLKISKRGQLPNLDLFGSYSKSQADSGFSKSYDFNNNEWTAGLSLTYTFPDTSNRVAYQQSMISLMKEKNNFEEIRYNIFKQVKAVYREVLETRERIEIAEKEVAEAGKRFKLAIMRFERGMGDNLEVVLSEENLLNVKFNYSFAITDHLRAQNRMKRTLGILNEDEVIYGNVESQLPISPPLAQPLTTVVEKYAPVVAETASRPIRSILGGNGDRKVDAGPTEGKTTNGNAPADGQKPAGSDMPPFSSLVKRHEGLINHAGFRSIKSIMRTEIQ